MPRYNPAVIEPKWQDYWEANRTFATPRLPKGRKLYVLDMFPYPSGDGLHVGHPEGYTATDIVCRYQRMKGTSVMHPMGWDAFGLPAEQHAKRTGTPPRITTEQNIANFRRQLKMLGFSYDWDRELATTDPDYFRWTQFIFLVLYDTWFDPTVQKGRPIAELPIPGEVAGGGHDAVSAYQDEHRLAYELEAPVNWCPALGTVLANEEVVGGVSERGGHPVVRTRLRQWMLRITAYAERLLQDLDALDWPESIKTLQRNWIGRSEGADVDFFIDDETSDDGRPSHERFTDWANDRDESGYPSKPGPEVLRVYTTRPDTLFGATYMVIAPEHPFVRRLTQPDQAEAVEAYCEQSTRKSDLDRTDLAKEKTGVFAGSYAINPVNGEAIPIWVADYVLISYGTGAIMAVPAHDTRDFEFAQKFNIPIKAVVEPPIDVGGGTGDVATPKDGARKMHEVDAALSDWRQAVRDGKCVYTGDEKSITHGGYTFQPVGEGKAINSGLYNGLSTPEFKAKITADLSKKGLGRKAINYKLRDWLFSRQHFWGEPFPILHELDKQGNPTGRLRVVPADELPLDLPKQMPFDAAHDSPEPPLEKAPEEWLYVTLDEKRYKRETNTMPQWAGSCWYYLRFLDPRNDKAMVDPAVEKAWMPVDLYVGGAEHAVLHLLYARFWHKVLYDRGYVSTDEPFARLVNQGMILGEMEFTGYQDGSGRWVSAVRVADSADGGQTDKSTGQPVTPVRLEPEAITKQGEAFVLLADPSIRIDSRAYKMSKSRGNVVNPDQVVADFGADSLRLYEMFMGPLEAVKPWSMDGVSGVHGFLNRLWRMIVDERADEPQLNETVQDVVPEIEPNRVLHKTIKAVTNDLDQLAFNTAIARMMEFVNYFLKQDVRPQSAMETFVLLLSPFAPHIAEELWQLLGHEGTLAFEPWPEYDEAAVRDEVIEVPVQIQGKLRARILVSADAGRDALVAAAKANPRVAQLIEGKQIVKEIVVPGRMVNFVVKSEA